MSVGRKKLSVCQNNVAAFSCCFNVPVHYIYITLPIQAVHLYKMLDGVIIYNTTICAERGGFLPNQ